MTIDTVILDRDGVINKDSDNYIKSPNEFIFIEKAVDAINLLKQNKKNIFIATNQSGINRKYYNLADFININNKLLGSLPANTISGVYYCPHTPDQNCQCRKPLSGMTDKIISIHNLNPATTAFIGDSLRDLQAAEHSKVKYKFLVRTGKGEKTLSQHQSEVSKIITSNAVFNNLYECCQKIISHD